MRIVNTYARDLFTNTGTLLLAVLTMGDVEDYAVYESIVPADMPREKAAEWVMRHGAKCNYARAKTYYPDLPEGEYRA